MKKKIVALAVVMMMAMATFSVPAFAIQDSDGTQNETENCWEFFCDMFENISQKIRKLLGLEEPDETVSDDCSDCSFEIESLDTQVWLAYIGNEYFQFEVTPVEGGLKNLKVKKLDNLDKVVYQMPNVKFVEIYGENIYIITANDNLMSIDVSTNKIKIVSDNATQFEWVSMNGNNRLAVIDNEGKTTLL